MTTLVRDGILTDNPIVWQETNYQQRSTSRLTLLWKIAGPATLALVMGSVFLTLLRIDLPTRELALYAIWIVHAGMAVRAISASGNVISREHVGQTWDALILTGVSARQILLGKWRAAMQRTAPWMLALGVIRLVMLPVFVLALLNRYAWRTAAYSYNYTSNGYYSFYADFTWVPWATVLAVAGTVLLTLLEMMCCTAIGLATSAVSRRSVLSMIVALSIRFMPVALFAGFTHYELGPAPSYMVLRFPPFAIADSGTSPLSQFALPLMPWTTTIYESALPGLLLPTTVMVLLLVVSLIAAWVAIRRSGALPHPKPQPA